MATDSRRQMLDTAIGMFRLHGYNGTGFRQVVAESGAPRGSMYHHFPGGKTQLGVEAVELAGRFICDLVITKKLDESDDFVDGVEAIWEWWIGHVEKANLAGCPVLAVAVESHPEAPELTEAADAAFRSWIEAYKAGLRRAGVKGAEAEDLALLILSALEGSTGIARASLDLEPLRRTGRTVSRVLRARLDQGAPRRR